jgi:hypothetical protein
VLAALTRLTRLRLAASDGVDHHGLRHLSALAQLQSLDIRRCKGVGDEALPCLAPLTRLTSLLINQCGVTGATLPALRPLGGSLRRLHLFF